MRKAILATAMLRPFGAPKGYAALGALPRNPRTMLAYDASLAWSALLLLAAGLVMVYSASIAMAEASCAHGLPRVVLPASATPSSSERARSRPSSPSRCR